MILNIETLNKVTAEKAEWLQRFQDVARYHLDDLDKITIVNHIVVEKLLVFNTRYEDCKDYEARLTKRMLNMNKDMNKKAAENQLCTWAVNSVAMQHVKAMASLARKLEEARERLLHAQYDFTYAWNELEDHLRMEGKYDNIRSQFEANKDFLIEN